MELKRFIFSFHHCLGPSRGSLELCFCVGPTEIGISFLEGALAAMQAALSSFVSWGPIDSGQHHCRFIQTEAHCGLMENRF